PDNCWSLFFAKPAAIEYCIQDIFGKNNSITLTKLCQMIFISSKQSGPLAEMLKTKSKEFTAGFHDKIAGIQSLLEVSRQKFFKNLSDTYALQILMGIHQQCTLFKVTYAQDGLIADYFKVAARCGSKNQRILLYQSWPILFNTLSNSLFVKF